jgi:hypothetical protein
VGSWSGEFLSQFCEELGLHFGKHLPLFGLVFVEQENETGE